MTTPSSSLLANQTTLTGLTNKFDGRTPIRIHFLDNSSKVFLVDYNTTAKDVMIMCLNKQGLGTNALDILPYFALLQCLNGASVNLEGALDLEAILQDIVQQWKDGNNKEAKFLFLIRLYMPCLWGYQYRDVVAFKIGKSRSVMTLEQFFDEAGEQLLPEGGPSLMQLQFIQAVYHVITGRYPTTAEQALELGAIHFLYKFGEYKPASHKPGFLGSRIVEFVPIKHLKSGGDSALQEWEKALLQRVLAYSTATATHARPVNVGLTADQSESVGSACWYFERNGFPISAQRKYMEVVFGMPCYGNTFFRCTYSSTGSSLDKLRPLPEVVYLGLYHHGVHVFEKTKRQILRSHHIEDIFRWGFKPDNMFYIEVGSEDGNNPSSVVVEFDTNEGKVMSDLLTDYALAFLREREREDDRLAKMKSGKLVLSPSPSNNNNSNNESLKRRSSKGVSSSPSSVEETSLPVPKPPSRPVSTRPVSTAPPSAVKGSRLSLSIDKAKKGKEREAAAVKIQALVRGFALRNEWAREDAAILIQCVFRGYLGRVKLGHIIETMIKEGKL